ncbi:organic solvent tolerance protein [Novosphingobium pentaromativorans US6-1]|uniref:LPS-assembly protein LptD n=2 Tax=Novosphingobium pentaromativorans TaxID=205844 RepID=G6E7S5_9SPHN|nr:organic solvent tolerance protein [Novosphingobium pentaromativorans US6-1]
MMLPAAQIPQQASHRRLRPVSLGILAAGIATLTLAPGAYAQDAASVAEEAAPVSTEERIPIGFEADTVEYDQNADSVTASGNVVLRREKQSVRADTVTWNRQSGQIVASGNVRLVDQDGNQLYTDRIELTDELKTGAMQNLLLALREGGRLAAADGERLPNGDVILNKAAYTGCDVVGSDGCPRKPSWRIVAKQVIYSEDRQRIRFNDARLELFGAVQLPLLGLTVSTNGQAVSGFLVPDFRLSPSNGVEISESYYWKISENRDLTATAYAYTKAAPMASIEYRALTESGAYQITGYATSSNRIPIIGTTVGTEGESAFRGYIFANGKFQIDDNWSVTASIRRASDRTFLRRYDISRDDRLRSIVNIERIDQDSYLSFAGYATQTMQSSRDQGLIPVAFPVLDYRRRFDDPVLGGKFETQINTLGISRSNGQDTQRAFASAQWSLRKLTSMGQEVTLTGLARGDVYHSDENDKTSTVIYRGDPGWQTRGIATAALDVKWPLVGKVFGGTQVLTPRVQLVATPKVKNLAIPNEDARAIELEDSNLFSLNRFPGYDRIEDSVRFTYGVDWQFEMPRWRISSTVGQSIRLSNKPTLLPDGTGLTNKTSDIVGRTEVRYRNFLKVIHRFRVDKDSLAVRRNEFDAVVGNNETYLELGYTKLNRDISNEIEDLQDREEVRAAGRVAFANYWSVFGSAVVNLTDRSEDPIYGSNGFQPLRTRLGAAYEDDCMQIAFTWRRDYEATGDARKGNSFQLRFSLKNIGFR